MGTLDRYAQILNSIGWFIPPYASMGFISALTTEIKAAGINYAQVNLENFLSKLYSPEELAAMVTERYPKAPFICEFKGIISESIEAHFLHLNHISSSGLIPVIEGVGRRIAKHYGVHAKHTKDVFVNLATKCKYISQSKGIGNYSEIESMMNSFINFVKDVLYANSARNVQNDKTNRHGILHGEFSDNDYGQPINFYKSIAAVDFLTFIASFNANISWFAPSPTKRSTKVASYYILCDTMRRIKSEASS